MNNTKSAIFFLQSGRAPVVADAESVLWGVVGQSLDITNKAVSQVLDLLKDAQQIFGRQSL